MGKYQREKGKRGERELAKLFQEALPSLGVRRTGQDQAHSAKSKPSDLYTAGKFAVECKRRAKVGRSVAIAGLRQAQDARQGAEIPLCCFRSDRAAWWVLISYDGLTELVTDMSQLTVDEEWSWWKATGNRARLKLEVTIITEQVTDGRYVDGGKACLLTLSDFLELAGEP